MDLLGKNRWKYKFILEVVCGRLAADVALCKA
jgi:hypothetical protein